MLSAFANVVDSEGRLVQGMGRIVGGITRDDTPLRPRYSSIAGKLYRFAANHGFDSAARQILRWNKNELPEIGKLARMNIEGFSDVTTYDVVGLLVELKKHDLSISVIDGCTRPLERSGTKSSIPANNALHQYELGCMDRASYGKRHGLALD